jgi:hypothetical protein
MRCPVADDLNLKQFSARAGSSRVSNSVSRELFGGNVASRRRAKRTTPDLCLRLTRTALDVGGPCVEAF